jgi:hypothetical protein
MKIDTPSLWDIIAIIIGTISVVVRFDYNDFRKNRDEKLHNRLINACPHVEIYPHDDENIAIKDLYISPPGTLKLQCEKCGHIKYENSDHARRVNYYCSENGKKEYVDRLKRFDKIAKKLKILD